MNDLPPPLSPSLTVHVGVNKKPDATVFPNFLQPALELLAAIFRPFCDDVMCVSHKHGIFTIGENEKQCKADLLVRGAESFMQRFTALGFFPQQKQLLFSLLNVLELMF